MDKIKFAVIGVGGFGSKRISSILRSEVAELAYIVDINKELARKVNKETNADALSFDELLSRKDYDVAIIATPNASHEEFAIKILDSGKDVWCEKPMAISIESAHRMLMKSIESGTILKVGSNPRYLPNIIKATEIIRRGYIGKKIFFRGWIGNEGLHLLSKSWYTRKEVIGGGTLLDNGVHLIDLVRYLVDEIIRCHSCKLATLKHNLTDLEDNAIAIYELLGGGLAFIQSSWTEKSGYMYLEIHGDEGYMHIDSRWSQAIIRYAKSSAKPTCEDYTQYPKMSYDLELEDFAKDYREGFHPKPTSYDGYRAVKIIVQSYLAATRRGATITFDFQDRELEKAFLNRFNVREAYVR
jgi:predicted dehydrogenase